MKLDSVTEVEEKLRVYTDNPDNIALYAKRAYECGRLNHSASSMKNMVYDDLKNVYCKDK